MAIAVTVTPAGVSLLAAKPARAGFLIQNPSNSGGTVWVNLDGGTATLAPPCIELTAGDAFSWSSTSAIYAISSAAGVTITVVER